MPKGEEEDLAVPDNPTERESPREAFNEAFQEGPAEGCLEVLREDLVELWGIKFGEPPAEVSAIIQATTDMDLLGAWFRLAVRASLEDLTSAIRAGRASAPTPQTAS